MSVIYTPNIVISKNYTFMNNFMEGKYFSTLDSIDSDDAFIFTGKQNKYVYTLEHSFNYNHSDTELLLKILDVDGNFENDFFNETFFEKLMNDSVNKYLKDISKSNSKTKFSDFQIYVNDYLQSQIKIYLAYGIGDNLETWTDPIACTLVGADVDVANNGLRTYTYKFIPQVNNFFRPIPEKDKNDPNRDVDFDFGSASMVSEYSIKVNVEEAKDVDLTLDRLIRGYMAKVCNVSEKNVIVVLPELNSKISSASGSTEPYWPGAYGFIATSPEYARYGKPFADRQPGEKVSEVFNPNPDGNFLKDDSRIGSGYTKVFRRIFSEFKSETKTTQLMYRPIKKYSNKQDVYIQIQKELIEIKRKAEKNSNIKKQWANSKDGIQFRLNTQGKINSIISDINQIEEILERRLRTDDPNYDVGTQSPNVGGPVVTSDTVYRERLVLLKIALEREEALLKNAFDFTTKPDFTEFIKKGGFSRKTQREEFIFPTNSVEFPAPPEPEFEEVKLETVEPDRFFLTIRADRDFANSKTLPVDIPDFREILSYIFNGIALICNSAYIVPNINYETNLKWLKLFKKYNLIQDETQPCVVVGDRQMVLDYLYCNQTPLANIFDVKPQFSPPSFSPISNLKNDYKNDIVQIVMRKRNSSSFSEKLYSDELDLKNIIQEAAVTLIDPNTGKPQSTHITNSVYDAVQTLDEVTKDYDIPIFINNFRNSNVISYSLKNTETYFGAMKKAVKDNRLKYLLSEFNLEFIKENLKLAGISDPNPIELAKKLFKQTVDALPDEIKLVKFNKIPKLDLVVFDYWIDNFEKEDATNKLKNSKYGIWLQSKLSKSKVVSKPSLTWNPLSREDVTIFERTPLLTTQDPDTATFLNLAIQRTLYDVYGSTIQKENLMAISEFIILLNVINDIQGNNVISFIPGLNFPTSNFILAKLLEYQHRYSTQLTLKTLPFFNLTDSRTINKPAIFFSKRIPTMNKDSSNSFDFFSGEWRIVGFRHVINTQECYSEFLLTKYMASDDAIK